MSLIGDVFNTVGMLMDSMVEETESIISFAEAICDMDVDMSNQISHIRYVQDATLKEEGIVQSDDSIKNNIETL